MLMSKQWQAIQLKGEHTERLGLHYALHLEKYIYRCVPNTYMIAQCMSTLAQRELAGKL